MAIYHLTAKTGSRSGGQSARAKAAYIQREGRYARGRAEVVYTQSGHLPEWAERSADYWDAADLYERANGRLFKEIEFALPVELNASQQRELVDEFARHLTEAERLPYTLAIHGDDSGNPHCHLMISERKNDGVERSAEQWFRRYNAKAPERGGAQKTDSLKPRAWLEQTREAWSNHANRALERAGQAARIDHRTLEAQGIERLPGMHLGPAVIRMHSRGLNTERADRSIEIGAVNSQLEWEEWLSRPDVSSDGHLVTELSVDEENQRSWELHRAAEEVKQEAAERAWQEPEAAQEAQQEPEAAQEAQQEPETAQEAQQEPEAAQEAQQEPETAQEAQQEPETAQEAQQEPTLAELREQRDAAASAVRRIDAEIERVVAERSALSPLKFRQRHKLQRQIEGLQGRHRSASAHYEASAERCQWAEDAPRREQAAAMAELRALGAGLGPEETERQPSPEQQRPANTPTRSSEPSPRPTRGWDDPGR